MAVFKNKTFMQEKLVLDGKEFYDCKFNECHLTYRAVPLSSSPQPSVAIGCSRERLKTRLGCSNTLVSCHPLAITKTGRWIADSQPKVALRIGVT